MIRTALLLLVSVGLYAAALEGVWQMDANYSATQTKDDFVKILLSLMAEKPQKLHFSSNGTVLFEQSDGTKERGKYFLNDNQIRVRFGSKVREGKLIYPERLYLRYPMGKSDFRLYFTNTLLRSRAKPKTPPLKKRDHNLTAERNISKTAQTEKRKPAKTKKRGFPLYRDRLYRSVKKIDGTYIYALFSTGGHFSWIALSSATLPARERLRHQERYFYRNGKITLESDGHRIRVRNPNRFSLIMKDRIIDFKRI
ncbi:MAG: hypothetical protein B6D59_03800 [Campylobacteraceae bacterium 4484_4]|nr:MAG: hypothetical protein B6D59_03800 [Campylobacteraceae bacterium 4484_4]